MSIIKPSLALTGVAALALALAACGSSSKSDDASSSKAKLSTIDVKLVAGTDGDACQPSVTSIPAGPITFTVTNQSATGVNEVEVLQGQKIVGEKENLAPGLPASSFTITLDGGKYQFYCPGAATELVDFTVTGKAAATPSGSTADILAQGIKDYSAYVVSQAQGQVTAVTTLNDDIQAGNLEAAQKQYGVARQFYEHIESDVDGFVLPGFGPTDNHGNLDYLIDMRASALDPAVGWTGFHAVERDIFGDGTTAPAITAQTKQYSTDLLANVTKLASLVPTLTYKPEDLANGAADLLDEVQSNKITGEEEDFSHIDLATFAANVEGAQQAFADLQPGLTKIDPNLTAQIAQQFAATTAMLDTYRDPSQVGGYVLYTPQLKATDANKLSQQVQALQEVLSTIAAKVATA